MYRSSYRFSCSQESSVTAWLLLLVQGQSLGSAAHMTSLRRTRIGDYHVDRAWTLEELQKIIDPTKTFEERTNWYQRHVEHGESDKISWLMLSETSFFWVCTHPQSNRSWSKFESIPLAMTKFPSLSNMKDMAVCNTLIGKVWLLSLYTSAEQ